MLEPVTRDCAHLFQLCSQLAVNLRLARCINHVFKNFSILWCSDIIKILLWLERDCPPRASQLLEIAKGSAESSGSWSLSVLCFKGLGMKKLESSTIAQSPLKLFKLASPKLFTLPCPSQGNPSKSFWPRLSLLSCFCFLTKVWHSFCDPVVVTNHASHF